VSEDKEKGGTGEMEKKRSWCGQTESMSGFRCGGEALAAGRRRGPVAVQFLGSS